LASSRPSPPTSTPKPAAGPGATPPANEQAARFAQWKNDPFWGQPELTRSWDLEHFAIREERQLGEQLNGLILQLNAEDREADLQRVKDAARPLLEGLQSKDRDYKFFVLNSAVPNAFSHPGGYIYLSGKLLEMLPEDEKYLLEFAVGHEIAHVELQHSLKSLRDPGVRSFTDGTLQKLYFLILPHGYPDDLEYAADAWAYRRMRGLGRSEHDCLGFLRKLNNYAKTHGFPNGRGKLEDLLKQQPRDGEGAPVFSPIDNHLRSHPAAYDRLNQLKALRAASRP
jgi:Zn-dependent protease with chaperone function